MAACEVETLALAGDVEAEPPRLHCCFLPD
uniref:Uncharacterized protein n=1 Tax=Arundo donax TaxID=35708 RepID=A0A0A9CDH7_ARUDO